MAFEPLALTGITTQLRLAYDAANYTNLTTGAGGDLTIAPSGGDTTITGGLTVSANAVVVGVLRFTSGASNVSINEGATDDFYISIGATVHKFGNSRVAIPVVLDVSGDVIASVIRRGTSDGADNSTVHLLGGGANSFARGGIIRVSGNEAGSTGDVLIGAGDVANGFIYFYTLGAEVMRLDRSVTATHTRLMIYDVDNATLERVSVGIADSGGAGFKLLRIPN